LVSLVKPKDIFPCVEDPLKLTYLDLEGCFGDICDISKGSYLRKIGTESRLAAEMALQKVLEERWAYDEISDDESDVDEGTPSVVLSERELNSAGGESAWDHSERNSQRQIIAVTEVQNVENDETTDDTDNDDKIDQVDETVFVIPSQETRDANKLGSQENIGVLYNDDNIANAEMISYYYELASKGGAIVLQSVGGQRQERVL
jgi:hypothetical protein